MSSDKKECDQSDVEESSRTRNCISPANVTSTASGLFLQKEKKGENVERGHVL